MSRHIDILNRMQEELARVGLVVSQVVADGDRKRCGVAGKERGTDGSYRAFLDQNPGFLWSNFKSGESGKWFAKSEKEMTAEEREVWRERARIARQEFEQELARKREKAEGLAGWYMKTCPRATENNGYLKRKGVLPFGDVRQTRHGLLVVPVRDGSGRLVSVQKILPKKVEDRGDKFFLSGGETGGCHFPIPAKDGGKAGPLLIAEGYATAASLHMATGFEVWAAFNAGNLPPVAKMARQKYPDRVVILCADNDIHEDGKPNTGVLKATEAAQAIGAKLAICPAVNGKKADFNDLHMAQGVEAVQKVIDEARKADAVEWEEPIPFAGMSLPKLDAEKLPPLLRDFCSGMAEEKQVPLELPVAMTLAALAAVAQNRFFIEVRRGYPEPMNIYTLCPLEPGNRKSSVAEACAAPIIEWEKEMAQKMGEEVRAARSARATLEKSIEGKRKKAEKMVDRAELEALQASIRELELSLPEIPHIPRLLVDNITPEGLAYLLSQLGVGMAILSAEGGIFDILGGMYSKGTPNLDLFLKAHDGGSFRVDRRGADPIILDSPCLTLGISPQPVTLAEREAASIFRRRGLDGRFLYFMPESLLGRRKIEPEPMPLEVKERFRQKVRSLLPQVGQALAVERQALKLSEEAYALWKEFARAVEKELGQGGEFEYMGDWGGKLAGAVARLAGLFHVADHDRPEWQAVSKETMERAVYFGSFLTEHAKAAYALMGSNETVEGAKVVLAWIRQNALERFTGRDCQQAKKNNKLLEDVEKRQKALRELEDRGYIRELPAVPGKKASPSYLVNPATLKG